MRKQWQEQYGDPKCPKKWVPKLDKIIKDRLTQETAKLDCILASIQALRLHSTPMLFIQRTGWPEGRHRRMAHSHTNHRLPKSSYAKQGVTKEDRPVVKENKSKHWGCDWSVFHYWRYCNRFYMLSQPQPLLKSLWNNLRLTPSTKVCSCIWKKTGQKISVQCTQYYHIW